MPPSLNALSKTGFQVQISIAGAIIVICLDLSDFKSRYVSSSDLDD